MSGFLQGLGEFAGGVSKGISQEAVDRARREQAKAAKQERELKADAEVRAANFAKQVANAPKVGDNIYLGGVDQQLVENRAPVAPEEPGALAKIGGMLSGLLSKKSVGETAVAAGVRPLPQPLGVSPEAAALTPSPLLATRANTAPVAAPAAEPVIAPSRAPSDYATGLPAGATAAAAAPEPQTPDEVPVHGSGGTLSRKATAIDRQLYLAKAYAENRQPDKAIEAYDKYGKMVIDRTLSAIDVATPDEIGHLASEASGKHYRVTQNEKDPELFSMSLVTTGKDGAEVLEPVMTDVSRGELKGGIGQFLGQDEELRQNLIKSSRDQRFSAMEARARMRKDDASIGALDATTRATDQGTRFAAGDRTIKIADMDDAKFAAIPGSAIIDPVRAARVAADPKNMKTRKVPDPATGLYVEQPYNPVQEKMDAEKRDWETNGWSKIDKALPGGQGVVQRVQNGDQYGFAVLGSDGQYMREPNGQTAIFNTPTAAYQHAFTKYGNDPVAAAAQIKAGLAAKAKTAATQAASTPEGKAAAAKAEAAKAAAVKAEAARVAAAKAAEAKKKADAEAAKAAKEAAMPAAVRSYRKSVRGVGSAIGPPGRALKGAMASFRKLGPQ